MGFVDFLEKLGEYLPAVTKPEQKPSLSQKLMWSFIALIVYLVMSSIPLYGVSSTNSFLSNFLAEQIIFASSQGTLAQLGIGPIITSGLIMQILVGSKLIEMDLANEEDQIKFTEAEKGLAFIFIIVESALFGYVFTKATNSILLATIVTTQLIVATYIILLLDEMIQKGWGLGSGISLFILAGVTKIMFWDMFGIANVQNQDLPVGFFPTLVSYIVSGKNLLNLIVNTNTTTPFQPDLVGLISTIALILLIIYLTNINVQIPVTSPRLRGIRSTIPLNFLYVSSIPVIFVSVLGADFELFASIASGVSSAAGTILGDIANAFFFPPSNIPHSVYALVLDPVGAVIYAAVFIVLSIVFGILWIDVAGLDPATQAQQMVEAGVEIPGMRNNPKVIESILAKYIYPLGFYSSLIVGVIAVLATFLGVYGTGVGLLLAVTIAVQYYNLLAYERTLEMYPLLKRIIGE
ncbi:MULTISPECIES: preprotein translocase subunit SecY [unclassified Stygiolobus]|uniref:preprotein translocase subunit SecY n=1 Tax=unclassified Stygiolobus TaxID=2824672 RepID=UPI00307E258D